MARRGRTRPCVVAMVAAAAAAARCSPSASAARPTPSASASASALMRPPARSVYVMRHCVRSVFPDLQQRGAPGFDHYANYTAHGPLPDWGVPPAYCTERGVELIRGAGASLADELRAAMGEPGVIKVRECACGRARARVCARVCMHN